MTLNRRLSPNTAPIIAVGRCNVVQSPETRYAKSGPVHLAYQVAGDGPIDLLWLPTWWCHVELQWEVPALNRFLSRLASFSRLIVYDRRGSGLSDPVPLDDMPTYEDMIEDAVAVLDEAGSSEAVWAGVFDAGTMGMMAAAIYPERVRALVTIDSYARFARAPDYPWGMPEEAYSAVIERIRENWGTASTAEWLSPSLADDPVYLDFHARYERQSVSPAMTVAQGWLNYRVDARAILSAVRVPTLIIQRAEGRWVRKEHGRYLAEHIDGSSYLELPGEDGTPWGRNQDEILDHMEEFVTGAPPSSPGDRVLATLMFTDIADSTATAARLGDQPWRDLLDRHDAIVRRLLERYRGREITTTGDGFMATFDGPARAIRCGLAITDAVRALGISVRVGVHTGEAVIRGEDLGGIAVHLAERVAEAARPDEVFVTRTVVDLVAGSGFSFEDEGTTEMKGIPGEWQLLKVVPSSGLDSFRVSPERPVR